MNNSVFGKTMENIRNHKDMRLVTNREKYLKYVLKPNFKGDLWVKENLMIVQLSKIKITINKPEYIGQAILDLSKIVMYEFHYDFMIPKYSDKLQLLYLDTDSLIYHIRTQDFYKDIALDVEARFDTSAYSKDDNRPLTIGRNKKIIGLMKDELGGKIMTEFVGLRAKLYAYKVFEDRDVKRCNGIKKAVVPNTLTFDNYKECLLNGKTIHR